MRSALSWLHLFALLVVLEFDYLGLRLTGAISRDDEDDHQFRAALNAVWFKLFQWVRR